LQPAQHADVRPQIHVSLNLGGARFLANLGGLRHLAAL
jgi:hypothetical protein